MVTATGRAAREVAVKIDWILDPDQTRVLDACFHGATLWPRADKPTRIANDQWRRTSTDRDQRAGQSVIVVAPKLVRPDAFLSHSPLGAPTYLDAVDLSLAHKCVGSTDRDPKDLGNIGES